MKDVRFPRMRIQALAREALDDMGDIFYDADEFEDPIDGPCDACGVRGQQFAAEKVVKQGVFFGYRCKACSRVFDPYVEKLEVTDLGDGSAKVYRPTPGELLDAYVQECIEGVITRALQEAGVLIED